MIVSPPYEFKHNKTCNILYHKCYKESNVSIYIHTYICDIMTLNIIILYVHVEIYKEGFSECVMFLFEISLLLKITVHMEAIHIYYIRTLYSEGTILPLYFHSGPSINSTGTEKPITLTFT